MMRDDEVTKGQVYISVERTKKNDPLLIALVFGIATLVFLILTFVIPSVMKNVVDPKWCVESEWIRRDEQAICYPGTRKDYVSRLNLTDYPNVKLYRMLRTDLKKNVVRDHYWSGKLDLSKGPFIFPITTSYMAQVDVNATCTGKCDSVKLYFILEETFRKHNKTGEFVEADFSYRYKDFTSRQIISEMINRADSYYLVISNGKQESVVDYTMKIHYTGFDVSENSKIVNCTEYECIIPDLQTTEAVIMEYLDPNNRGPEVIPIYLKSRKGTYAGVVIFAIIFLLCTLGCGTITVLSVLTKLGKINLFNKGQNQGGYDGDSGSYEAPLVPGQGGVSISRVTIPNDDEL